MTHDHSPTSNVAHEHVVPGARSAQTRVLRLALAVTAIFLVVEVVGGVVFGSLALSADAAHMFSDSVALAIALVAQHITTRPVSARHTFGWQRAEVLAAQFNALLLLAVSAWIATAAVRRLSEPVDVDAEGVVVVAALGLIVNLFVALMLRRSHAHAPGHEHNMNVRAATLHTLSDAGGSLAVLAAGVAIAAGAPREADALASLVITLLVVVAAGRLIVDTTHVLLEGAPRHLDAIEIERTLSLEPNVVRIHHLHLWSIAADTVALSAHIELDGIDALHDAQAEGERLKALLAQRFGIDHSTLELECHPCSTDPDVVHVS